MKDRNICKFVSPSYTNDLHITCFVYESNPEVIQTPAVLRTHALLLFTKGSGTVRCDNTRTPFASGTLLFCFKGETLYTECENACEYMYISFDGVRADVLFNRFHIRRETRCFTGLDGLLPLWKESLSRASEETVDLAAESILLYTFSRLFENCNPQNELIDRIIDLTEAHFTDFDLSLTVLAEELGYNAKYLSHLFKKRTGTPYSEYLRTLRIRHAVSLMNNGLDSIKNVALLSGFSDPLYFSTVFKQVIGLSPREYVRESNKNLP
ncbi:MAG: helix-turn-helix transcriptional regulator [Ruminococcaceae bacterium]|nr:helix-turn-helix transcriptional regulator [Oscillospiraceae bacterium]